MTEQNQTNDMQALKTANCQTLSGKSNLTYHIGCDQDQNPCIRIAANTGGGFFSNEWIRIMHIQELLTAWGDDKPITAITLWPLFKGKSVNTPAFLLAVLKAEGVVISEAKKRFHKLGDIAKFQTAISELVSSKSGPTTATTATKKPTPPPSKSRKPVSPKNPA